MAQFIVLLYDNVRDMERWTSMGEQEMQDVIEEYGAWSTRLAERGKLRGGEKLRDGTGRVLRGRGRPSVTDGPFAETKEIVGGFFLLEAADYDEAVALAVDCPHLAHGGTVEIREIEPMPAPDVPTEAEIRA